MTTPRERAQGDIYPQPPHWIMIPSVIIVLGLWIGIRLYVGHYNSRKCYTYKRILRHGSALNPIVEQQLGCCEVTDRSAYDAMETGASCSGCGQVKF